MTGEETGTDVGLRELQLAPDYRSDHPGSLVDEFYVPCLERSTEYRRAVGYFTSDGLSVAARGLAAFIAGGGTARLVASPMLEPDDAAAISRGYEKREDVIERALLRQIPLTPDLIQRSRLECIAWLISQGRLEIKLAFRVDGAGAVSRGIYHEKIGVFSDGHGDAVAFTGSPNETAGGLITNFESIDVFWSWDDPSGRVGRKLDAFERLWTDETGGLRVIRFPDAARRKLLEFRPTRPPSRDPETSVRRLTLPPRPRTRDEFVAPTELELRDYQQKAIDAWENAGYAGIFEMATGTGKTLTSLAAASRWAESQERAMIVVLAPYQHLVDQWEADLRRFGPAPLKCYESADRWIPELQSALDRLRAGVRRFVVVVATHHTASDDRFAEIIGSADVSALVIGDEVHHLGAGHRRTALPDSYQARLGLSATPERWLDPDGTAFLTNYFGGVVFEYPLGKAIEDGFLTRYVYRPLLVELSESEVDDYIELTRQIARMWHSTGGDEESEQLGALLRRRAGVLNNASGKLPLVRQLLLDARPVHHTLVYTGPQLRDPLIRLIGHEIGLQAHTFTAKETRVERARLLERFADSTLDVLVAIRCLDEGVDVPATRTAILVASSSNPREFIQRRGRILRRAPGKDRATIYDLIAHPPDGTSLDDHEFEVERQLVERELLRFREFADHADNSFQAESVIADLAARYHLRHI